MRSGYPNVEGVSVVHQRLDRRGVVIAQEFVEGREWRSRGNDRLFQLAPLFFLAPFDPIAPFLLIVVLIEGPHGCFIASYGASGHPEQDLGQATAQE